MHFFGNPPERPIRICQRTLFQETEMSGKFSTAGICHFSVPAVKPDAFQIGFGILRQPAGDHHYMPSF